MPSGRAYVCLSHIAAVRARSGVAGGNNRFGARPLERLPRLPARSQDLGHAPGLGDTTAGMIRRFGIENFTHGPDSIFKQVRLESF